MKSNSRNSNTLFYLLSTASVLLSLAAGSLPVSAATQQISAASSEEGEDIQNDIDLFDDSVVHTIQIIIPEEDFDEMVSIYQETGEKEYFEADVIIDGVTIEEVGLRLKGNSSLSSALGGRGAGAGGPGGGGRPPGGGNQQERMPVPPDGAERPGPGQQQTADTASEDTENHDAAVVPPQGGAERPDAANDEDAATKIPFIIKFDKYVDGQTYQGYSLLAIRTSGHYNDAAMLQEPVTNAMFRLAGLPATQTSFAGVQLNDDEEQLYTLSEVIDEDYVAKYFSNSDGILYKSEMGASLSYNGEDAADYASIYDQKTDEDNINMTPIIEFTRFLDEADDATFDNELAGYLDVDSFAAYLAANNLLVSLDTIAGMNNNYYLYYDDESEIFTLLMWDSNESLGGMVNGGSAATYDLYTTRQAKEGAGGPGGGGGGGPMGGKDNVLVTRFMASEKFKALYEEKLQEIYQEIFVSGALVEQVNTYASLMEQELQTRELADVEAYQQAVQDVLDFISERSSYLASTTLLRTQSGGTD